MQKIILTTHVRQRMSERGISFRNLRAAFEDPIDIQPAKHGCEKVISFVRGRSLVVIFERTGPETCVVLTAYWRD
jgi:hypothetical protein